MVYLSGLKYHDKKFFWIDRMNLSIVITEMAAIIISIILKLYSYASFILNQQKIKSVA